MVETLDMDWYPFELADGQRLVLDVNWGPGGDGRAETSLNVYEADGTMVTESGSSGVWDAASPAFSGDPVWVESIDDQVFTGEFTWIMNDQGGLTLVDAAAAATGGAEVASQGLGGMLAGGDVVFGGDISMGDVRIGGEGQDTYRITAENSGEIVTILDFQGGEGGATLDITDLLTTGSESLDVSYNSDTQSTVLTVSSADAADTIIVVQGIDLTSDFDTYVITDTII
jgi:hypothetical protein